VTWLHTVCMGNLPSVMLSDYLEALQTLKAKVTLNNKNITRLVFVLEKLVLETVQLLSIFMSRFLTFTVHYFTSCVKAFSQSTRRYLL